MLLCSSTVSPGLGAKDVAGGWRWGWWGWGGSTCIIDGD